MGVRVGEDRLGLCRVREDDGSVWRRVVFDGPAVQRGRLWAQSRGKVSQRCVGLALLRVCEVERRAG